MVSTPVARIASSSASEPPRLWLQYLPGSATDSPTSDLAAKCSTASMPLASTGTASVRTSPQTNRAPDGTASAWPVDRSSSTVTSWPAAMSCDATTLPMYPAPPVTSSLMCSPSVPGRGYWRLARLSDPGRQGQSQADRQDLSQAAVRDHDRRPPRPLIAAWRRRALGQAVSPDSHAPARRAQPGWAG